MHVLPANESENTLILPLMGFLARKAVPLIEVGRYLDRGGTTIIFQRVVGEDDNIISAFRRITNLQPC
jgi:hypothetical protein